MTLHAPPPLRLNLYSEITPFGVSGCVQCTMTMLGERTTVRGARMPSANASAVEVLSTELLVHAAFVQALSRKSY